MKKTILLCLLLCNSLLCYSKDYSFKIFKDYFERNNENYEFNVRNPFFADKFYVKNLNGLKNKIIKETLETYTIDKEGRKLYDDSDIRTVVYNYYIIDSEGRISDKYYLNKNDKGIVFFKQHEQYSCSNESYTIQYEDLLRKSTKLYNGIIEKKDDRMVLSFDNKYKTLNEIEFRKNKIIKRSINNPSVYESEIFFNKEEIQIEEYNIKDDQKNPNRFYKYNKCSQIEQKCFVPSGNETYTYEIDNTGHGIYTYFKENTTNTKIIKQEIYRKFNSIGFLEYEEKKPYNSKVGDYTIHSYEILSEKDELFLKNFE